MTSEQSSPIQSNHSWSPPTRQTSAEIHPLPETISEYPDNPNLQSYVDQYASYNQYSGGYYDLSYQNHPQMYNDQMVAAPMPVDAHQNYDNQYYAPLDQYSRVQSVGDLKMASRVELEMSRHGISMSQPDLSTASWGNETKYQVL